MELESRRDELARQGLGLAALSPDRVETLRDFAERRGIGFPLLSDPDSAVIRAFGLLNETVDPGAASYGVPHPGTLVVDRRGVVRQRDFEEGYVERRSVGSLLGLGADASGRTVEGDGVVATLSASDDTLATGRIVTLRVDLAVRRGAHVYAPGAEPYRGLALVLDEPPLVTEGATTLPRPKILKFRPTKERVPVFEGRVRLRRDVAMPGAKAVREWLAAHPDGEIQLTGRLEYQTCTTTECGPPSSLPVSWTFRVEAPDLERVPEALRRQ